MIKSEIIGIFPTPIYTTNLNRDFTKKELNLLINYKNIYSNLGNKTSVDTTVLENINFKILKKELNLIIKDYFEKVINTKDNITPYITQSWLNFTKKNEFHHSHKHPNSYISGVLYIDVDEKNDKIFFSKNNYEQIYLSRKDYNLYNSDSWWLSVKTGDVVLFPSSTEHSVSTKNDDNIRVSLAFNVFIKGKIGDKYNLTELEI